MGHRGVLGINEKQCNSLVFARAGGRCERCGGIVGGLSRHHRKKRSQGGAWSPENVVLVCGHGTAGCHGFIEDNPEKASQEGWHVRPWEEPDEIPVKWQRTEWLLLLPDGGTTESDGPEKEVHPDPDPDP